MCVNDDLEQPLWKFLIHCHCQVMQRKKDIVSQIILSGLFIFAFFKHASMCVTCAIALMEVRGLLGRIGSLPSWECLGSNSGSWACWQLFLPTEPSC